MIYADCKGPDQCTSLQSDESFQVFISRFCISWYFCLQTVKDLRGEENALRGGKTVKNV